MNSLLNPLNAKLNPICHLLELLGAHPILHVSRIRVKGLLHYISYHYIRGMRALYVTDMKTGSDDSLES